MHKTSSTAPRPLHPHPATGQKGRALHRLLLLLLHLLLPSAMQAQSPSAPPVSLAEGAVFRVEMTKSVFCGKDAEIRVLPKNDISHLTNVNYTLEENFGSNFKTRSDDPTFGSLVSNNYTMVVRAADTTTASPFEERIPFLVPAPTPTPARDYALYDQDTRVSLLDVSTATDLGTGRMALRLAGGKGLATTTIRIKTYIPTSGFTPRNTPPIGTPIPYDLTALPDVVMLQGRFPAGHYEFDIFDGCDGTTLNVKFQGRQLKELFPIAASLDFCSRALTIEHKAPWSRSSHIYFDGTRKIELAVAPKGQPFTEWWTQEAYKTTYTLTPARTAAIDAAGGYDIALRYANLPQYVCPVETKDASTNVVLLRADFSEGSYLTRRDCFTWTGYAPWFYTTGALCTQQLVITKKATGEVIRTFDTLKPPVTSGFPYNTDLLATATANGVFLAQKEFRINRQAPYVGFKENLDVYQPSCIDAILVAGNLGDDCLPVLRITDAAGNVVYHRRMPSRDTKVPCLNYDEEYTAEFFDNLTSTSPIAPPAKFKRTLPKQLYMYGWQIELCDHLMTPWMDWEEGYYQGQKKKWPVGSVWTFEAVDVTASALPYTHVYQFSSTGYFYLPRGTYPPGRYKVTIDMDPASTADTPRVYYFDFAGGFRQDKPLHIDVERECTNFKITASHGTYKPVAYPGFTDSSAKQIFLERRRPDGTWEAVAPLTRGTPYNTTQKGHYRAFIGTCRDDIREFDLDLPAPRLKYYNTFAYYCGRAPQATPSSSGTILIEAEGGTPPYDYHLYELDPSKPFQIGTHVKSYLNQPVGRQIDFTGLDVKAYKVKVEDACRQYFFQEDVMRPFSDVAKAFVSEIEVCEGDAINLFTYNIKGVTFHWTKQGDPSFSHPQQHERSMTIPHAALSDAGTYRLDVRDQTCEHGAPFTSTIHVAVRPVLASASLDRSSLSACRLDPFVCQVLPPVGGRPPYTYQWEWSKDQGTTWLPADGQTQSRLSFIPPDMMHLSEILLRCRVSDSCSRAVLTPASRALIRTCLIPVNPHLMHRTE